MMRRVLLMGLAAVSLWGQVTLECNRPADVTVTKESPQANLQFQGSAGEAV